MTSSRFKPMSLLLIIALGALFAACGQAATSSGGVTGSITYWMYQVNPNLATEMQTLKGQFESSHPGTTINIVLVPKDDFNTKLATSLATGTQPDASMLDQTLVAKYAGAGSTAQVPDGLINKADFFPNPLATNLYNNALYGLPVDQVCVALYYNKDLLPAAPTTWAEMLADAQKVYNPGKQIAAVSFPTSGGYAGWVFPAFVNQAGGTMLNEQNKQITFADKPGVDALTYLKQLYSYSPSNIVGATNSFATGHVAMLVSGPWEISGFQQNFPDLHWGAALLPKGVQDGTNIGGENNVVYKQSKNQALAWQWLKFLTGKDANRQFNDADGQFPINVNSGALDSGDPTANAIFAKQLNSAQARPTNANWLTINDNVIGKAVENALLNGQDPQTVLNAALTQAKTILGW